MERQEFIDRYPVVYHMAEAGAWPSIQAMGLLSTTALLDRFEITGDKRFALESARRRRIEVIRHPEHGAVSIRDNGPLLEHNLKRCLHGMTMQEWYELLNRKVFFWVRHERLERLLRARAYQNRAHDVLVFDTERLLQQHGETACVAPFNTGATIFPTAPRRGRDTFCPVERYDYSTAVKQRGKTEAIVELTVDYSVTEVGQLLHRAERREPDQPPVALWAPS